jgi:hypothetical protein
MRTVLRRLLAAAAAGAVVVAAAACGFDALGVLDADADADADAAVSDADAAVSDGGSESSAHLPPGADGDSPDQLVADTSTVDVVTIQPACPVGQVLCGATCVSAMDCTACNSGKFHCKTLRTCVTSCTTCQELTGAPLPIECVACDTSQNNPIASCEASSAATFCLSGNYSKAYRGAAGKACNCNNGIVSNCPAATHTCFTNGGEDYCHTCGQSSTNNQTCKNGKTCDTTLSPPACQ